MAEHHSKIHSSANTAMMGGMAQEQWKIRASHLLVKHSGSRRPSSWKEKEIIRSKEEARDILLGYEKRIRSGDVSLAELAVSESDCGSARKGGDLYVFKIVSLFLGSRFYANKSILFVVASLAKARCKNSLKTSRSVLLQERCQALLRLPVASI